MRILSSKTINLKDLPQDVKVATMSSTGRINCLIDIISIWDNINANKDIVTIKYNKQIKSIDPKVLKKKTKKSSKNFYNCIILVAQVSEDKTLNVKLFQNGSFQMTGAKNLEQIDTALNIIFRYLKKTYKNKQRLLYVLDEEDKRKKFDYRKLKFSNFKIDMINTNFCLDFKIHLKELFKILQNKDLLCTYEPSIHAGINIKFFTTDKKKVTILIFQSKKKMCNLIITGATNITHVNEAYKFITEIINDNKNSIIKINIEELLTEELKRLRMLA